MSYLDNTGLAYFWQKIKTILYSASNPPPYPVQSVNGQTGAVVIPAGITGVNVFIGDEITNTFSISSSGMQRAAWTGIEEYEIKEGYAFVGWFCRCFTYRALALGVSGVDQFYYYVTSTSTTAASFGARPIFIKNEE